MGARPVITTVIYDKIALSLIQHIFGAEVEI
jgi:hypothetical protein